MARPTSRRSRDLDRAVEGSRGGDMGLDRSLALGALQRCVGSLHPGNRVDDRTIGAQRVCVADCVVSIFRFEEGGRESILLLEVHPPGESSKEGAGEQDYRGDRQTDLAVASHPLGHELERIIACGAQSPSVEVGLDVLLEREDVRVAIFGGERHRLQHHRFEFVGDMG